MTKIGFVGFGNMGRAIAQGLERRGFRKEDFIVAVRRAASREKLTKEGYKVLPLEEVVKRGFPLFLAVKPKDLKEVLEKIKELKGEEKLIISTVAGVPLKEYYNILGKRAKVVRTMPNINVKYNRGVWGAVFGENLNREEREKVKELLAQTGLVVELEEGLLDAFTALAGSGPAFVAEIVDAFAEAGVKMGFKYEDALKITLQTFLGTLEYLQKEELHPVVLRDRVTSPGGTTIYGLSKFHQRGIKGALMEVVEEAKRRAEGLA